MDNSSRTNACCNLVDWTFSGDYDPQKPVSIATPIVHEN
jgi:hypothetical protein